MMKGWIVIANGSHACVYKHNGRNPTLELVKQFESKRAEKQSHELGTDVPGRGSLRAGASSPVRRHIAGGGHHGMTTRIELDDYAKNDFAETVAAYLNESAINHLYDRLIISASPEFLGMLRSHLSNHTQAAITSELPKDLTHMPRNELGSYIMGHATI